MLFREEVLRGKAERLYGQVVLDQPRAAMFVAVLLGVLISAFLIFAVSVDYARTESVNGILITNPPAAKINVVRQGIVSQIYVEDGDFVKAGTPLMRIDTDTLTGDGLRIAAGNVEALEQEVTLQRKQSLDVRSAFQNEKFKMNAQIADLQSQVTTFENQVTMQQQIVESNQNIFVKAAKVAERGFVSEVELERRRQQVIASEQQLRSFKQQLTSVQHNLRQAELARAALGSGLSRELSVLGSAVSRLERERDQVSGTRGFVISSPITGRITAMQLAVGQTATPGISAMTVVPSGGEIEAQLFAPSRAVGLLESGQEVNLLIDAFPYQRFGNVDGKIERVSATIIDPRQIDAPFKIEEPIFRVRVLLTENSEKLSKRGIVLQPGMTLQAGIVLERRSFLRWLLSPLTAVSRRNQ